MPSITVTSNKARYSLLCWRRGTACGGWGSISILYVKFNIFLYLQCITVTLNKARYSLPCWGRWILRSKRRMRRLLSIYFMNSFTSPPSATHYCNSNKARQGLRSKAWELRRKEQRLSEKADRRSLFAWRSNCTDFGISGRRNTYPKSTVITPPSNLGLFSCEATKKHLRRFIRACTSKYA